MSSPSAERGAAPGDTEDTTAPVVPRLAATHDPVPSPAADVDVAVATAGPDTGPAVVLVPDLLADHRAWEPTAHTLAAAGFRVIAPDLPGRGATPPPRWARLRRQLRTDADSLAHVVDAHDLDRPILVGWSLGAVTILAGLGQGGMLERRAGAVVVIDASAQDERPLSHQIRDAARDALTGHGAGSDRWLPGARPTLRRRLHRLGLVAAAVTFAADRNLHTTRVPVVVTGSLRDADIDAHGPGWFVRDLIADATDARDDPTGHTSARTPTTPDPS